MKLVRRLTLTLLCGIGFLFTIDTYLSIRNFARFYDDDVRRDLRMVGRALASEAERLWPSYGAAEARRLVDVADERHREVSIAWLDYREGQPSDLPPDVVQLFVGGVAKETSLSRFVSDGPDPDALETYIPVSAKGRLVGAIRIAESAAAKHAYVRNRILQRVATAVSMVALCAILAWLAGSRMVARPVEQLMQQARRIGEGDFAARLAPAGGYEFAALSRAMNEMAAQLERSRSALEQQNAARLAAVEQLRHADRLKTVGTLASGVAHELGTPLQVIAGRAEMITSGELASAPEMVVAAAEIRRQSERVARIVRQLLDFARRQHGRKTRFDLRQIAREAVSMLAPLAQRRGVRVELGESAGDPVIAVIDPAQLEQAVTNLLMNALQATAEGHAVSVSVGHAELSPPDSAHAAPAKVAFIAVRDQGQGIPAEQLPQIFDPFFTTKEVGEGTGLGLSVAHGIACEHGGWIDVESREGAGSCFRICLRCEAEA